MQEFRACGDVLDAKTPTRPSSVGPQRRLLPATSADVLTQLPVSSSSSAAAARTSPSVIGHKQSTTPITGSPSLVSRAALMVRPKTFFILLIYYFLFNVMHKSRFRLKKQLGGKFRGSVAAHVMSCDKYSQTLMSTKRRQLVEE